MGFELTKEVTHDNVEIDVTTMRCNNAIDAQYHGSLNETIFLQYILFV